jgi:protease I
MFEKFNQLFHKKSMATFEEDDIRELSGTHAAILAVDGFEESELFEPKEALENVGVQTHIISMKPGKIKGWKNNNWGKSIAVDMTVLDAFAMDFDYLILPGGVMNPDKLRNEPNAVAFVETFVNQRKPIAAICHGPQILIETGFVKGKKMTSWPSLKTDLKNAGAKWVDQEAVVDGRLITSRKPGDLIAFNQTMIQEFIQYHTQHTLPNTVGYVTTL